MIIYAVKDIMDNESNIKFNLGEMTDGYKKIGCQYNPINKRAVFRVWAPAAGSAYLMGTFNGFDKQKTPMNKVGGFFECEVVNVNEFDSYKFALHTPSGIFYRPDPYADYCDYADDFSRAVSKVAVKPFLNASKAKQSECNQIQADRQGAINIYVCHISSWRRKADGGVYNFSEFGDAIIPYLKELGYTHLELVDFISTVFDRGGIMREGAYFSPDTRHGSPYEFTKLVDRLHENGISLIIPISLLKTYRTELCLKSFDGTPLYLSVDDNHKILKFNIKHGGVRSFLLSSVFKLLDVYCVDGIRTDDPSDADGAESEFLRSLNIVVKKEFPNAIMLAHSKTENHLHILPVEKGGFGYDYISSTLMTTDILDHIDPTLYTREGKTLQDFHKLDNRLGEKAIIPMSYTENGGYVNPVLSRINGKETIKFSIIRLYYMYLYAHPGKKELFMGAEFGQLADWEPDSMPEWHILRNLPNQSFYDFIRTLNMLYLNSNLLHDSESGIRWITPDDNKVGVYVFERILRKKTFLCIINMSLNDYKRKFIGSSEGNYTVIMTSDSDGWQNTKQKIRAAKRKIKGSNYCIMMDLPPLSAYYLVKE